MRNRMLTICLQMVDFGKEAIDLEDEDAVDRIIQCSQAASPFFSVRNYYCDSIFSVIHFDFKFTNFYHIHILFFSNKFEVRNNLATTN